MSDKAQDRPLPDAAKHWEYLGELAPKLESELGLDAGFLFDLLREDDWSFVIKLHALLEGAVTHLLTESSNDHRLAVFFQRLPLNNLHTGKLGVVKALTLFEPWQLRFVATLSHLRNGLTHDVKNVSFRFARFWLLLSDAKKDEFLRGVLIVDKPSQKGLDLWKRAESANVFKTYLWHTAVMVLADVYLKAKEARLTAQAAKLDAEMARLGYEFHAQMNAEIPDGAD